MSFRQIVASYTSYNAEGANINQCEKDTFRHLSVLH